VSKPKLVIVFGAGASQALSLAGTRELSDAVKKKLRDSDGYPDLSGLPDAALVRDIKAQRPIRVEPLIDSIRRAGSSNFETDMNVIESMMTLAPLNYVQAINERMRARDPAPENVWGQPRPRSPVSKLVRVLSVYEALYDYETLMELMVQIVLTVRAELDRGQAALPPKAVDDVGAFIQNLAADFDIAPYTLNYDTILDDAMTRACGGFEDGFVSDGEVGRFEPRRFLDATGLRLAHLHGSTKYRVSRVTAGGMSEYAVVKLLPSVPSVHPLKDVEESFTQAGDFALIGPIITGLRKAEKTRTEPYGTYAYALERDILTAERILLVGYGGADIYLNHQLLRARSYHGAAWKPAIVGYGTPQPSEIIFLLAAAFANVDIAQMSAEMTKAAAAGGVVDIGPLHLDVSGWLPGDVGQASALRSALA
jgi:hypothetical protein